jgi:hypothetical protein
LTIGQRLWVLVEINSGVWIKARIHIIYQRYILSAHRQPPNSYSQSQPDHWRCKTVALAGAEKVMVAEKVTNWSWANILHMNNYKEVISGKHKLEKTINVKKANLFL